MPFEFSSIYNAYHANFVNYSRVENLKKFCMSHGMTELIPQGTFTRNRKMNLPELMGFLLMPRTQSEVIELVHYSQLIDKDSVNKSNFSTRRRLIPAEYLHELLFQDVQSFYRRLSAPANWQGRLIVAADGTTYSLPDVRHLRDEFLQGRKTGRGQQPLARGIVMYDPLNRLILDAGMDCYGCDEITLLNRAVERLPTYVKTLEPLFVLDRKYCAYTLFYSLMLKGIDFVVRAKGKFSPQLDSFIHSGEKERIISLTPGHTTQRKLSRLFGEGDYSELKVRACRIGNITVMTSVLDPGFKLATQEGSDVYHLRWKDETTIGFCKNNLQIEIFSSTVKNCILQEFYAKIIAFNYLNLFARQAAQLRHDCKKTHSKYEKAINLNIALGLLKLYWAEVVGILTVDDAFPGRLLKLMGRFMVSIRPGRHEPRKFRKIKHSGKYITLTNYARAI